MRTWCAYGRACRTCGTAAPFSWIELFSSSNFSWNYEGSGTQIFLYRLKSVRTRTTYSYTTVGYYSYTSIIHARLCDKYTHTSMYASGNCIGSQEIREFCAQYYSSTIGNHIEQFSDSLYALSTWQYLESIYHRKNVSNTVRKMKTK